jgi:hypothetical protein
MSSVSVCLPGSGYTGSYTPLKPTVTMATRPVPTNNAVCNGYRDTFTVSPEAKNFLSLREMTKPSEPRLPDKAPEIGQQPWSGREWLLFSNAIYLSDILSAEGMVEGSYKTQKISASQKELLGGVPLSQQKTFTYDGKTISMIMYGDGANAGVRGRIMNVEVDGKRAVMYRDDDKKQISIYTEQGLVATLQLQSSPFAPSPSFSTNQGDSVIFDKDGTVTFSSLGKLLGIEETCNTKSSLLSSLNKMIDKESGELTKLLNSKLAKAGLDKITKKITFAEDADGNIVVKGNINARQKKELARIINDDPELVERIKTQKARMEIAGELKKDGKTDKKTGKIYEADFSDSKFDAARTQLLKDFLQKNELSLEDVKDGNNEKLAELLTSFSGLKEEIQAYQDRKNAPKPTVVQTPAKAVKLTCPVGRSCGFDQILGIAPRSRDDWRWSGFADNKALEEAGKPQFKQEEEEDDTRSLLSMKRGELSEGTDEKRDFNSELSEIRGSINKMVDKYNESYMDINQSQQIMGYSMRFDENGRLSIINVHTKGDDPIENARAELALNHWVAQKGPGDDENISKGTSKGQCGAEEKLVLPLTSRFAADEMVKAQREKQANHLVQEIRDAKEKARNSA